MKICFCGNYWLGGSFALVKELKRKGHKCFIIYDSAIKISNEIKKNYIICQIKFWLIEKNKPEQKKVLNFLKKTDPDIFLTDFLFPAGYLSLLAKTLKIPTLAYPLGIDIQYYPEIGYGYRGDVRKRKLINLVVKSLDGYLLGAKEAKRHFYKNWKPKQGHKIWLVPGGHNTPNFRKKSKVKLKKKRKLENKFVILTLSRLHPKKGIEYLVKALPKLLEKNKNCYLLIAGPTRKQWYKDKLEKEIKKFNLNDYVAFAGGVYGKNKEDLYLLSDVFVIPSICEVVHATLLEAFHYGLPVVSTPVGHSIDLIKNKKNGLLVLSQNPKDLVEKISILINDQGLRKKFARRGKKIANKRQWKNCANKWLNALNKAGMTFKQ